MPKPRVATERRWPPAKVAAENYGKTKLFQAADAASPLAHELFDKPLSEAKPWDALFGWGEYGPGKTKPSLTQPSDPNLTRFFGK